MRRLALAALWLAALGAIAPAQKQTPTIERVKAEAREAAIQAQRFEVAAADAGNEAERSRAQAEALAARIQAADARISAAEAELRLADAAIIRQRARLAEKQQPVVQLTAALQTMARHPPALALARAATAADLVHVRALLTSSLPEFRRRTATLRHEADAARRLRGHRAATLRTLAAARSDLRDQRIALIGLQSRQLQRAEAMAGAALLESDRVLALNDETRALERAAQTKGFDRQIAADLAGLPGPLLRPGSRPLPAHPRAYRLPVQGRVTTGFGEVSSAGLHSRGMSLQAGEGAAVVAPRSGRVAYAGRFRSYGEVVIVDHGGGWTSTITGLSALSIRKGDVVNAGATLGRAGTDPVTVELRQNGVPRPIAPLLAPG
jgi:septal ring factor EnvC (AmiA/AmiB activator)